MATRAFIKFVQHEQGIYNHYDGYPEGLGVVVNEFVKWLGTKKYSPNEDYHQEMMNYISEWRGWDSDRMDQNQDDEVDVYFDTLDRHRDIDYLYTVDLEKATCVISRMP